ncbi:hypothetical protein IPA_01930 [Ignicoccus pacificus DSM 13166]|uniref:DUF1648 domain-containing protein n=1 Tax=Ignicoccus pacificus DSM 13166 TaxID=940294 RepID=A0A977PLA3_9CREN|nr:hypothetical protein IPA_01930 [Ignicoccus pacificus DSM 13166]
MTTLLFIINLIVSISMMLSDKLKLNRYKAVTKIPYKNLKVIGALMFLINFVDPLIADIFMGTSLVLSFALTLKEIERRGELEGLLEGGEGETIKPFELGKVLFITSVSLMIASIALLILAYPILPQRVVVHFGIDMKPNGWMDKVGFAIMYLVNVLMMGFFSALISWMSFKEPGALYSLSKNDERNLKAFVALMFATQLIATFAMIYLLWYNLT